MYESRCALVAVLALAASAAPVAAASSEAGGQALLTPHIGTIVWTIVTFIALAVLLRKFAWGHLVGAVEQREKNIQAALEQARREREEAEDLARQNRELLDQARRERAAAVEEGRQDAEKLKGEILDEARRQKEQLVGQAEAQIEASVRQAKQELRSATVDLAIEAAGKLLARNLDDAGQRKLVEDYLSDLERSSREAPS